ncbi:hypothetical protein K450DRAFT_261447 [Umbelopsis ramanniana AG]|uniref:Uncharacterized protein n=1 Tax=Umbelopsis ramanniana AG TaxID=1314678 RepID=A0AAD5E2G9_UMBRA|nr:uncharacterized protein K450DRAFT_261447 [Umbelopsis ramanniana AG]KAI8575487.1 hypothetical protein K450DRAFT_261447 [Umbelopsis ramanniana AG]
MVSPLHLSTLALDKDKTDLVLHSVLVSHCFICFRFASLLHLLRNRNNMFQHPAAN